MKNSPKDNLARLRKSMEREGIDAYIIPSSDPHQTEYVHPSWRGREWISGFTGSAGTVVVTPSAAGLWTDGRYFIQAEQELAGSGIELFRMLQPGVPKLIEWIAQNIREEGRVGFDGRLITVAEARKWEEALAEKKASLIGELDLVGEGWLDRPPLPDEPALLWDIEYAGRSVAQKLSEIRDALHSKKADIFLLSSLYDIAWLFNIRGNDTPRCPILTSYAMIDSTHATLFVDGIKLSDRIREALEADGITVKPYDAVFHTLETISTDRKIYLCPGRTSEALKRRIPSACEVVEGSNLTELPKARKNEVELKNWQQVQELDGVAMVRFWKWLEEQSPAGTLTECSAADQLEAFRRAAEACVDLSFSSISAYGPNAAMMHYFPRPETCATLETNGFYLIDSGGQYLGGTTDITRTFALGELSDEERTDYTQVLKGVINLSRARFLKGTAGNNLDILARQPLWEQGLDYKCGTGHGVGCYLNVHEGPQNFSQHKHSNTPFEPGMILTIEPGVYKEGRHGIRTENMVVVEEDCETESGSFYRFSTLTLCPIDITPLKPGLLSSLEIEWLNEYHEMVQARLAQHLNAEETAWLETKTHAVFV